MEWKLRDRITLSQVKLLHILHISSGTSSVLINPLTEHCYAGENSVSLGRRASRGAPADGTLQYPPASCVLAHKRPSTVPMATAQDSSRFPSTDHVRRDLKRRAT